MSLGIKNSIGHLVHRLGRWGIGFILILLLAISTPFIANEKPYYCVYQGQTYFPMFGDEVNLPLGQSYKEIALTKSVYPLIPFSAKEVSPLDKGLSQPWTSYQYHGKKFTHYLGTDRSGRDVLSGILNGLSVSMMIGLGAIFIATLIGLFLGLIAGYYENKNLRWPVLKWVAFVLFILGLIYIVYLMILYKSLDLSLPTTFVVICFILLAFLGFIFMRTHKSGLKTYAFPVDNLVMRLITIIHTIPNLLFLMVILSVVDKPSILLIILILGLLIWTSIARYTRAETMKVKAQPYIQTLKNFDVSDKSILFKHILPNTLLPVITAMAFGIASAILSETFLSFLGLGLGFEEVTWGSMINQARRNFTAWWLVIFPGAALFFTLWFFHKLGQNIKAIIDPYYEE